MEVNFLNLQKEIITDYNRVVGILKDRSQINRDECELIVDGYQLETCLRYLHNNLAIFASISLNGEKRFLDGTEVKMDSFDFDEMI
jgi:hypothetical protein